RRYLDRGVRILRVIPAFHPSVLDEMNLKGLAEFLAGEEIVLLFQWMIEDYRSFHGLVRPAFPSRQQVLGFLSQMPCDVVLGGITYIEAEHILANTGGKVFVEISYIEKTRAMEDLVTPENSNRLLFGTMAPLLVPEAATMKVQMSRLDAKTKIRIFSQNALQLIGG
ncbi:MAG TPA: hypothetical protein PKH07_08685, partial [bacterium]|nr:hypothetical protein [bacterium]